MRCFPVIAITARAVRANAVRRSLVRYPAVIGLAIAMLVASGARCAGAAEKGQAGTSATILVYHRFGPRVADAMTITTDTFVAQVAYLNSHGYNIVPLRKVVEFAAGRDSLPRNAVAITIDDGHRTVFTELKPIIDRYRIPVTLFIYPSAISNASYAMTWEQLGILKNTGLFDIESHTYWHPNFNFERKRLTPTEFDEFARSQFTKSRFAIEKHLGVRPDLLAWPFGIYSEDLIRIARDCGYVAGFTIERRPVTRGENIMALPRYLLTAAMKGPEFEAVLRAGADRQHHRN
jgi:peptidoglycan/xylan/chitin deacetylase (PgdA/CDA1 family)